MKWITFKEYAIWRQEMAEGLWLNDSEAVEGLSKRPQPKQKKPPNSKPPVVKLNPVPKLKTQNSVGQQPGFGSS